MRNPQNDGPDAPVRRCIVSGDRDECPALIRLAISPDGLVLPDVHARAPGRGAWIGVSNGDLAEAMAKGRLKAGLARAHKGAAMTIPDDLPARIDAALIRALCDRLGLEARAGKLLTGHEKIATAARKGDVVLLLHAADAGADGSAKLDQAWRVGMGLEGSGLGGVALPLDREALSMAMGRNNVVHLAITGQAAAQRVVHWVERLLRFRGEALPAGLDISGAHWPEPGGHDDEPDDFEADGDEGEPPG